MASQISKNEWIEILGHSELTNALDLSIFQALYSFSEQKAYASQIGILLGYTGKSPHGPLNLEIGRYAKRIAKYYDIEFTERSKRKYKYWDLFFEGSEDGRYFFWKLKPEIVAALEARKLTGKQPYPEEIISDMEKSLIEGIKRTVIVNSYERNPTARRLCIKHWGCVCAVCNFNFQENYGDIGIGFIHVHHLIPLSNIGESYQVNPINDLRPICPNCHAMLHTSNPPLEIEELKKLIQSRSYS